MEDSGTPHPIVDLLLRRIETHREEFIAAPMVNGYRAPGRWEQFIAVVREWGSAEDWLPLKEKLRDVHLQSAHGRLMAELCNGEERRYWAQQQALQQAQQNTLQAQQNTWQAMQAQAMQAPTTWLSGDTSTLRKPKGV